jgi:hypothetical protein
LTKITKVAGYLSLSASHSKINAIAKRALCAIHRLKSSRPLEAIANANLAVAGSATLTRDSSRRQIKDYAGSLLTD